jgi:hypothetical protein
MRRIWYRLGYQILRGGQILRVNPRGKLAKVTKLLEYPEPP